jgi:hypothetical protein
MKNRASSHPLVSRHRLVPFAGALSIVLMTSANAQLLYNNGQGDTVYGVAEYGGPPNNGAPTFIPNNVTLRNDVLTSPGGGFLTADTTIPNNIAQTGPNIPLPLFSFEIGGGNVHGPFGASANLITGPNIGFTLKDFTLGGGSASYTISSWTANFTAGANGFNGPLDAFLLVGGGLVGGAGGSADAVSLVTSYSINGGNPTLFTPLVLAAAGNGNHNAVGGRAAVAYGPGNNSFFGFAFDSANVQLNAGDTLTAVTTLTALADPASIESLPLQDLPLELFGPDDQDFLKDLGADLRTGEAFLLSGTLDPAPALPDVGSTAVLLAAGICGLALVPARPKLVA